ncbi:hypothetical protein Apa02nite_002040 [Actinoplanes palleronii]|uniref:Beta-lactamase-related domain-containing protein n=1 Tax=Actinoplanes palleronii TaxID=113570 RepID=A0ABQ4B0K8_9ACTN|nr:serine hydrolase [Actinoplanes palleronii]GIE64096.1 hypothetical protein Apa02nite_002040 [Actinoplanes palleronii]
MADDLLADFVRADRERALGTYGIHVHREGHEPLIHRFRSDDRVNLYSVSKTFTAVAAGLAEAEGLLSLDDLFLDHFPELRPIAADGFERSGCAIRPGTPARWGSRSRRVTCSCAPRSWPGSPGCCCRAASGRAAR